MCRRSTRATFQSAVPRSVRGLVRRSFTAMIRGGTDALSRKCICVSPAGGGPVRAPRGPLTPRRQVFRRAPKAPIGPILAPRPASNVLRAVLRLPSTVRLVIPCPKRLSGAITVDPRTGRRTFRGLPADFRAPSFGGGYTRQARGAGVWGQYPTRPVRGSRGRTGGVEQAPPREASRRCERQIASLVVDGSLAPPRCGMGAARFHASA
jgi:hypothetical protein